MANHRHSALATASVIAMTGVVLGANIPDYERQVMQIALDATFRKAENDQYLGVPLVAKRRVVEVLRGYAKKHGSAFGTSGWESQVGRWLAAGVFPNYTITHMGVMRSADAAKLGKARQKNYTTRQLSYIAPTQPQKQQTKKTQPATTVPVNHTKRRARNSQPPIQVQAA
jgi:hypothetical protein